MDAPLFSSKTITRYGGIVLGLYLGFAVTFLFSFRNNSISQPLMVSDFSVYWAAANLWRLGLAAQAYLEPVLRGYVLDLFPTVHGRFGWFYPPLFYLCILPFAYLPLYYPAFLPFAGLTLSLFMRTLKRAVGSDIRWIVLFSSAAFWLNLLRGQNGYLTAGLMILSLVSIGKRPPRTGVSLALLTIKPQLALLLPLILFKTKAWQSLCWFVLTLAGLMGLGLWVLGVGTWHNWLDSLQFARALLEHDGYNSDYWYHTTSVYTFFRLLDCSSEWAYAIHFSIALLVVVVSLWAWRKEVSLEQKGTLVVLASLLVSPYVMEYDLCATIIVLYWGVRFFEKRWRWVLVVLWQLPLLSSLSAAYLKVQLAAPVLLLAFAVTLHAVVQETQRVSLRNNPDA